MPIEEEQRHSCAMQIAQYAVLPAKQLTVLKLHNRSACAYIFNLQALLQQDPLL